jgi:hypothetical protein
MLNVPFISARRQDRVEFMIPLKHVVLSQEVKKEDLILYKIHLQEFPVFVRGAVDVL